MLRRSNNLLFDDIIEISESCKRQTLLNMVKTRYQDVPVYMDIASVISQYTLESKIDLGLTWLMPNSQSIGEHSLYTDRSTITYNPLMGEKYIEKNQVECIEQTGFAAHVVKEIID